MEHEWEKQLSRLVWVGAVMIMRAGSARVRVGSFAPSHEPHLCRFFEEVGEARGLHRLGDHRAGAPHPRRPKLGHLARRTARGGGEVRHGAGSDSLQVKERAFENHGREKQLYASVASTRGVSKYPRTEPIASLI